MMRPLHSAVAATLFVVATAQGQSLTERVAAAGDGAVVFAFTSRPGICGDGEGLVGVGQSSYMGNMSSVQRPCVHGPVQVRVTRRGEVVQRVESWVGPARTRDGRSLGTVPAAEAARYLLALARNGSGTPAAKAVAPAVFADSVVIWPDLLAIARDASPERRAARNDAAFWLSRFAAAAIGGHPEALGDDGDRSDEDDVKVQAVFALSQLPGHEGIEPLLQVARSGAPLTVRRTALFWLGQSGDARAIALFEAILRG